MKKKVNIGDISQAFLGIIFIASGILVFTTVPCCYKGTCGYETSLSCGSLIIYSSSLIILGGITLYLLVEGWIREKILRYRQKRISKIYFKDILKKVEEGEE